MFDLREMLQFQIDSSISEMGHLELAGGAKTLRM